MSQTPDIVDRVADLQDGNAWDSTIELITDLRDEVLALRSERIDLQATIVRLTRELGTVLSREAKTQRRHDAKVDTLESQLGAARDAEAAKVAAWLRSLPTISAGVGYSPFYLAKAIARHEHRKD